MVVFALFLFVAYPSFYYSYKFGSPDVSGQFDFYDYYPVYADFDFDKVEAPYNMRLVSTSFVYLLGKTGFYYPVETSYKNENVKQSVYFQAIFVHFLAAALTAFLIWLIVFKHTGDMVVGLVSGALYILQYGTLFWGAGGLTDGFSALMFVLMIYLLLNKSYWLGPLLLLSVFQREAIILGMGAAAGGYLVWEYVKTKKISRYYIYALVLSVVSFALFMYLRKTLFFTPKYAHHLEATAYFNKFDEHEFSLFTYLRGTIFSQNIGAIYLIVLAVKYRLKQSINIAHVGIIFGMFFFFHLIRAAINPAFFQVGRHMYMVSGLMIVYLGMEMKPLFDSWYRTLARK